MSKLFRSTPSTPRLVLWNFLFFAVPPRLSRTSLPHDLDHDLPLPRPDIEVDMYYLLPGAQR